VFRYHNRSANYLKIKRVTGLHPSIAIHREAGVADGGVHAQYFQLNATNACRNVRKKVEQRINKS